MTDFMMCLYSHGGVNAKSVPWIKTCHQFSWPAMRMCEEKEVMRFLDFSSVMFFGV